MRRFTRRRKFAFCETLKTQLQTYSAEFHDKLGFNRTRYFGIYPFALPYNISRREKRYPVPSDRRSVFGSYLYRTGEFLKAELKFRLHCGSAGVGAYTAHCKVYGNIGFGTCTKLVVVSCVCQIL